MIGVSSEAALIVVAILFGFSREVLDPSASSNLVIERSYRLRCVADRKYLPRQRLACVLYRT